MFDTLLSALTAVAPYSGDLVSLAVAGLIAYLARSAKRRIGLDIDARQREVLHSAAMSAIHASGLVDWALKNPTENTVPDSILREARTRTMTNGGDAVRHFLPGIATEVVAAASPLPDALDNLLMRKGMEILRDLRTGK